ncbi:MAG: hypothetical protein SOZ51_09055 [Eubacteriales bacterium]|nr:hypothetical protein [Eubacteriales bacterium]
MKRVVLLLTAIVITLMLISCSTHVSTKGFENWHSAASSYSITSSLFLENDFLTEYAYQSGNYFYQFDEDFFPNCTDKSFAWFSYDDESIYQNAKQSRFDKRFTESESYDGTEAFGFSFYLYWTAEGSVGFPNWFTAFGFNDQTKTLVFLGFYSNRSQEDQYIRLIGTDFGGFLTHYYGDWYDW